MIYLDNNATTCVATAVRDAMAPFLDGYYANPSSPYSFARRASSALEDARAAVAALVNARPAQIVFTSGGTESNNTAIRDAVARHPDRRHLVTSAIEHASVLNDLAHLERQGYRITRIPVDRHGLLDLEAYRAALTPDTALVSVMAANNETGVLFPLAELARMARERSILFHTDAVQAFGKAPDILDDVQADYLSVSAHKFHGPKGVGALFVRGGRLAAPLLVGGDQENGRRAGTENVPGIVGLGRAAELIRQEDREAIVRMRRLRDRLEEGLRRVAPGLHIPGSETYRLPNTSLALFEGVESEALLALLDMADICCSSGSACLSGAAEPSHVLRAMGWPDRAARGAVRFSLSRFTTEEEIDEVIERIGPLVVQAGEGGRDGGTNGRMV